jgi:hypothetical protein
MVSLFQDDNVPADEDHVEQSDFLHPVSPHPDEPVEYRLSPRERYGWWVDHEPEKDMRQVAMVHGAVNDVRVKILLDTGASVSMISLDLARRLKVNLNRHKQIKLSDWEEFRRVSPLALRSRSRLDFEWCMSWMFGWRTSEKEWTCCWA